VILRGDIGMTNLKNYLILWGLLAICSLGGCASQQEILHEYHEKCRSYGFAEGTVQFADCMQKQDLEQQRDSAILASSNMWGNPWFY
jgi:hypothetical protein